MPVNKTSNTAWNVLRRRCMTVVLVLTSTCLLAQDFLSEFVEVTTRKHVDHELGFSVEYPYEWNPSANPIAESDFYVGAPYAMPSFWLNVRDIPEELSFKDKLALGLLNQYPDLDEVNLDPIEFDGRDAIMTVINWTTQDAGRHFVETTIVSFLANDRWYQLTVNQSYRDTRWRPRLQALLDSFTVLESES